MTTIELLRPGIRFSTCCSSNYNTLLSSSFFRARPCAFRSNPNRFVVSDSRLISPSRFSLWEGVSRKKSRTIVNCQEGDEKTSSSDGEGNEKKKGGKEGKSRGVWWSKGTKKWEWEPIIKAQEVGVLLLQLGIVMFVVRLLRPGIRLPGSEPRTQTTFLSVPYSDFLSKVNNNEVQKVEVDGVHVLFKLKDDGSLQESETSGGGSKLSEASESLLRSATPTKRVVYSTTRPRDIKTPYEKMLENNVEFGSPDKRAGGFFNSGLIVLFYIAVLAGLLHRFPVSFSQSTTGQLRTRKSGGPGGRKVSGDGEIITFADVAGVDEAKEELEEIVEFLKNPDRYVRLGARPPRGVLLVGLPGTGKTLLAKAVAGESEVPSLVALQIDAVAKSRDNKFRMVSNDEREQTLNQLLTEMDGFDSSSAVIVLGATNRADVLDPALRRPGRFDRVVAVETPNKVGRESILKVHVTKKELPLGDDVNLGSIASMTTGFTGADLANLVNEAALLAGRKSKTTVDRIDFIQAVERSIAGIEKKTARLKGSEKAVVARHEAGHAVVGTAVANLLPGQSRVEKLSILPRSGGALGFTYIPPTHEDRYLLFIDELHGRLVTLLGGRAAEDVVYSGRISTGALDDIRRATDMAYKAVAEYGLNQKIGPVSVSTLSAGGTDDSGGSPWGRDQGNLVDLVQREVTNLLQSALDVALTVVHEEKVEGEELQKWLNKVVAPEELAVFIKGKQAALLPAQASSS
ncbi:hypothetical protein Bca4012_011332 [Brassica carinata]